MKKYCTKCNTEYTKTPSESVKFWLARIYCSHSCANSVNSNKTRLADYVKSKGAWNKGLKSESRQNLHTLICKECRGYFLVRNYRKETAQFCSKLCKTNNSNQGKTPTNEKIRKSAAYKAWRTLVFERDNYTCLECNVHGGYLHADHIKPFALFPSLRLEVSNGRTLCVPCHKKTGTYGRKSMYRILTASAQEA